MIFSLSLLKCFEHCFYCYLANFYELVIFSWERERLSNKCWGRNALHFVVGSRIHGEDNYLSSNHFFHPIEERQRGKHLCLIKQIICYIRVFVLYGWDIIKIDRFTWLIWWINFFFRHFGSHSTEWSSKKISTSKLIFFFELENEFHLLRTTN